MFDKTQRFLAAVALINKLPADKFPLVLSKIARGLVRKESDADARVFTVAEEEQLLAMFELPAHALAAIIDVSSFILSTAAYHGVAAAALADELTKVELERERVIAFGRVWEAERKAIVDALRERRIAPKYLHALDYRLHLQMATRDEKKLREPVAVVQFTLADSDAPTPPTPPSTTTPPPTASSNAAAEPGQEKLNVEFSHSELYAFFDKLETIQAQLDSMG